jgi:hypothetical protein
MSIPQAIDFCKTTSETQQCFVAYESVKPRGVVIASTFPKFIYTRLSLPNKNLMTVLRLNDSAT